MASILITNAAANPGTISPGGTLTLSYDLDGNNNEVVNATYSLSSANNVYFVTAGGFKKTIMDSLTLQNPPGTVSKQLTIDQGPASSGQSAQTFDIYVQVTDPVTGDGAVSHCNAQFQ